MNPSLTGQDAHIFQCYGNVISITIKEHLLINFDKIFPQYFQRKLLKTSGRLGNVVNLLQETHVSSF